jgi:voltage-gated potassium channel
MRQTPLRITVRRIIFEHDTVAGKTFDVLLIIAILLSVLVVMLDSIPPMRARYGQQLAIAEWGFTIIFSVEYLLRLWSARRPRAYALSFFGVIDLLAVLPAYLSILFPAGRFLAIVRILRVLRAFRVLKLAHYVQEAAVLSDALRASRHKITVFIFVVLNLVVVAGSLMYLVEGAAAGFTSIPRSIYWAIVTITTVGYGDIAPQTTLGQFIAAGLMVMGYGIIAVPTGIVTLELERASRTSAPNSKRCPGCGAGDHGADAVFCRRCGRSLAEAGAPH